MLYLLIFCYNFFFIINFVLYIPFCKYFRFSKFYPEALEIAYTSDNNVIVAEYTGNIQCFQLFKGFTSLEVINIFKKFINFIDI